ncbi:hypothetical protein evm_001522 [Chilo suppressalis]|nr:hypothetical protein evm_001522 [Chilo suppressalis]
MDNSFFEYRDATAVDEDEDSNSEIIDDSLVEDSFVLQKKTVVKNHTVFVAESDNSGEDETDDDQTGTGSRNTTKNVVKKSNAAAAHLILSSDDDSSKRGSIRRQSETSDKKFVLSSSEDDDDEGEWSPEIVPRKRPPKFKPTDAIPKSVSQLRSKKRMIIDSDTDNSILLEHDKNRKVTCLKDTPLKIDGGKRVNQLSDDSNSDESDKESEEGDDLSESGEVATTEEDAKSDRGSISNKHSKSDEDNDVLNEDEDDGPNEDEDDDPNEDEDDGPDEDQMVMSRATRMSIMGVIPKDNDSDESDFIQSDESKPNSHAGSTCSLNDLPDVSVAINKTVSKPDTSEQDISGITCSPFSSPLKDITNELNSSKTQKQSKSKDRQHIPVIDLSINLNNSRSLITNKVHDKKSIIINDDNDDDVTIIDSKPEIIDLSSDDDDEVKVTKKSPSVKKSPKHSSKVKNEIDDDISEVPLSKDGTIRQYLAPPSYPNQVVYVKKNVRETELRKLNGLQEDLLNIRNLLENMDVSTLPDGGVRLIERLTTLEAEVRRQGDKVANMVVQPDQPTAEDIAAKGTSWDDIQKASNSVQPRMFGKQAMATHMAERNMILERLRDLHESLASRPPESQLATAPIALTSELMPHQKHALAWLRWRETQRPCGGILADDMGLGKTITMIALLMTDKEDRIDHDDDDDDDDDEDRNVKSSAKTVRGGTLVVCPASLMQQWSAEVTKHCKPHSALVCLHHGAARAQQPHRLAANDLVVTTYNILQRDHDQNGVLMRVRWRRVILDEAHIVRNHKSATSLGVAALKAKRRWCLTGTPVQNKDLDLFALVKFLRVTPFTELQMWKKWIDNKSQGGQERLSTIMRCILLRRTKVQLQQRGQLACLPSRTAHQKPISLASPEMNVYQKVLVFSKTLFAQFLHQRAEMHADAEGFVPPEKDTAYAKMHKKMIALQGVKPVKSHEILVLLLRLRQVCCHCGLVASMLDPEDSREVTEDPAGQDLLAELNKLTLEESSNRRKSDKKEEEETEAPEEGTSVAEAIRSVLSPNNPVFDLARPSSKIAAVMECLKNDVFAKSHKAVVVSQWTSVLKLVEEQLRKMRVRFVSLTGSVPVTARPPLIAALNDNKSDVRVMLLSLCAGGVGLNLCGANHLLLLDPHWNPQLEQQAQDRIYRVGQKNPVHIYRFMCVDTVEQSIRKLQDAKLELADNVLTGARHTSASKLSIEDLKLLFNMGQ